MTKEGDGSREGRSILEAGGDKIRAFFGVAPEWLAQAEGRVVPRLGFLYQYSHEGVYEAIFLPCTKRDVSVDPSAVVNPEEEVTCAFWYQASPGGKELQRTLEISLPLSPNERKVLVYKTEEERPYVVSLQGIDAVSMESPYHRKKLFGPEGCGDVWARNSWPFEFTALSLDEIVGENGAFAKAALETLPQRVEGNAVRLAAWWKLLRAVPTGHTDPSYY